MSHKKGAKSTLPISFASLHDSDEEEDNAYGVSPNKDFNYNTSSAIKRQENSISEEKNEKPNQIIPSEHKISIGMEEKHVLEHVPVINKDHPLAHNSSSSSLSSLEYNESDTKSKSPPKIPPHIVPVPSVNISDTQDDEPTPKLRDAIFNPKARSKLFTSFKKNIHSYYTGAANEGAGLSDFHFSAKISNSESGENLTQEKKKESGGSTSFSSSMEGRFLKVHNNLFTVFLFDSKCINNIILNNA